jgi:hypothetical protein
MQGNEDKQEDKDVTVLPQCPRLLIRGKRFAKERWRSASISLDGLLDYDEEVCIIFICG